MTTYINYPFSETWIDLDEKKGALGNVKIVAQILRGIDCKYHAIHSTHLDWNALYPDLINPYSLGGSEWGPPDSAMAHGKSHIRFIPILDCGGWAFLMQAAVAVKPTFENFWVWDDPDVAGPQQYTPDPEFIDLNFGATGVGLGPNFYRTARWKRTVEIVRHCIDDLARMYLETVAVTPGDYAGTLYTPHRETAISPSLPAHGRMERNLAEIALGARYGIFDPPYLGQTSAEIYPGDDRLRFRGGGLVGSPHLYPNGLPETDTPLAFADGFDQVLHGESGLKENSIVNCEYRGAAEVIESEFALNVTTGLSVWAKFADSMRPVIGAAFTLDDVTDEQAAGLVNWSGAPTVQRMPQGDFLNISQPNGSRDPFKQRRRLYSADYLIDAGTATVNIRLTFTQKIVYAEPLLGGDGRSIQFTLSSGISEVRTCTDASDEWVSEIDIAYTGTPVTVTVTVEDLDAGKILLQSPATSEESIYKTQLTPLRDCWIVVFSGYGFTARKEEYFGGEEWSYQLLTKNREGMAYATLGARVVA